MYCPPVLRKSCIFAPPKHRYEHAAMRFKDIEKANPDCSQKMLTQTLRGLEADGLVCRTVYPEMPPRVEYALTDRGRSFMPVMRQLMDWAYNNLHDIISDREKYHGQNWYLLINEQSIPEEYFPHPLVCNYSLKKSHINRGMCDL